MGIVNYAFRIGFDTHLQDFGAAGLVGKVAVGVSVRSASLLIYACTHGAFSMDMFLPAMESIAPQHTRSALQIARLPRRRGSRAGVYPAECTILTLYQ